MKRTWLAALACGVTLTASAATPYLTAPVDPKAERLSPNFTGHDAQAIANALGKLGKMSKGEYETTAQFEQRLEDMKGKRLLGTLTMADPVAVLLPANSVYATYDADKSTLNVGWDGDSWSTDQISLAQTAATIYSHRKVTGSYVAANAFNRKILVQRVAINDLAVIFEESHPLSCAGADIEMPAQRAKALKPNLRAVLVSTLIPNYIDRYKSFAEATITYPDDVTRVYVGIKVAPPTIWFIDHKTGEILARVAVDRKVHFKDRYDAKSTERSCR